MKQGFFLLVLLCMGCASDVSQSDVQLRDYPTGALTLKQTNQPDLALKVYLATTPKALEKGLMFVRQLPAMHGMWFDFGQEQQVAMWMKNTYLSLDMLFFNEQKQLVHITERTTPQSLRVLPAPMPVRYVLEVNAGFVATHDLAVGAVAWLP